MSLTVTKISQQDIGTGEQIVADVLFDSSYPHGGEVITARNLGFRVGSKLDQVDVRMSGSRIFEFVPDATLLDRGKIIARDLIQPRQDYVTTKPGLAIGTVSAAEVKVTNILVCVVGGAVVELAAAEKGFTATTHDITADSADAQEAYFLLSTVDGINVVITKGTTADEGAGVPPAVPSNAAPIGLVKVVVDAGSTDFNATTDDLDASHLTTTFEDMDQQVYQATDLSALTTRVVATGR